MKNYIFIILISIVAISCAQLHAVDSSGSSSMRNLEELEKLNGDYLIRSSGYSKYKGLENALEIDNQLNDSSRVDSTMFIRLTVLSSEEIKAKLY